MNVENNLLLSPKKLFTVLISNAALTLSLVLSDQTLRTIIVATCFNVLMMGVAISINRITNSKTKKQLISTIATEAILLSVLIFLIILTIAILIPYISCYKSTNSFCGDNPWNGLTISLLIFNIIPAIVYLFNKNEKASYSAPFLQIIVSFIAFGIGTLAFVNGLSTTVVLALTLTSKLMIELLIASAKPGRFISPY